MATWYVRPDTSHSATRNGTSYATAFGGWSEILWASLAAGDTLFLCGSFDFATTAVVGAHNGVAGNPVVIRGDGDSPGAINITVAGQTFTPKSHTKFQGIVFTYASRCFLNTGSLENVTITSCSFSGGNNCAITFSGNNTYTYTDISILNSSFTGGNDTSDLGTGAAISWFVSTASALTTITRMTITGNSFTRVNPTGNSRGVISFRTENDTSTSSIVTDLIIDNNTFKECRGYAIEVFDGHSYGAASPQFGLWKGIKARNNVIENQYVDDTKNIGGGMSIFGVAESPTSGFGTNDITDNVMNNLTGQTGGINVGYGAYQIKRNKISNLYTHTIDACGILLDDGIKRTVVSQNYIYNAPGIPAVQNTGAGIMFLDTESTLVYGNIIENCKFGIYLGSVLAGSFTWIYNNTFLNCIQAGILIGSGSDRTSTQVYNNVFTGTNTGTNYSVQLTGGNAWTNEDYNCFYNFATAPLNHTIGTNSITSDPKLVNKVYPSYASPLIAAGRYVWHSSDYDDNLFQTIPTIGACEYLGVRGTR